MPLRPFRRVLGPETPQQPLPTPPSSSNQGPQASGTIGQAGLCDVRLCRPPAPVSWRRSSLWWTSRALQLELSLGVGGALAGHPIVLKSLWNREGEGLARGHTSPSPPGPPPAPQKLQLVLTPFHNLASRALEHGLPDPGSLLAHSLRQLDRIDSLSEQISFLEEQLGSCECRGPCDLPTHRVPLW